jgi:hypothetical protein
MLLLLAFNLVLNTGHLSYPTIDDYQLLFMLLFLSIDYPQLNHFLYGFRYRTTSSFHRYSPTTQKISSLRIRPISPELLCPISTSSIT